MEKNTYEVESFSIGNIGTGKNKIVFRTLEDLEQAYKDIDNGRDIYIVKDGIITRVPHQSISSAVYELRIEMSALAHNKGDEN
jgi:hypothetical protein